LAKAKNIYVAVLNGYSVKGFTVKHELQSWLDKKYPKCPTNMCILKLKDGDWHDNPKDVTAEFYLKEADDNTRL
jgi:hypothetical protein